jgi:hypothetical protein
MTISIFLTFFEKFKALINFLSINIFDIYLQKNNQGFFRKNLLLTLESLEFSTFVGQKII